MSTPEFLASIRVAAAELNFTMSCDEATGSFLRTLARSKPAGSFLEIGTGVGVSACWLLEGMDSKSTLISIDTDAQAQTIAQQYLGHDQRITFQCIDGEDFIHDCVVQKSRFDFIFADSWPGKFIALEETLSLLKSGGIYVVDDLLPQANWPPDHPPKVEAFIETMLNHDDFFTTQLNWSTGLLIAVKK